MQKKAIATAILAFILITQSDAARALTEAELIAIVERQSRQIEDLNRRISALEQQGRQQTRTTSRPATVTEQRVIEAERKAAAAEARAAAAEARAAAAEARAEEAIEKSDVAIASTQDIVTSGSDLKFEFAPAPTLKGKDPQGRDWEFKVRGRLLVDGGFLGDKDDLYTGDNATEIRAARLGVEAKFFDGFKVKFETDFANNDVDIKDAFLEYKGRYTQAFGEGTKPLFIRAGQYKTPNSLEEQTSARFTTFMERAAITDAFDLNRRVGLGTGAQGSNWALHAGLFGQNAGVSAPSEGLAAAGRGYLFDSFGGEEGDANFFHVGGSVRYRGFSNDADNNEVRYRQRPFFHFTDKRSVNTGFIENARSDVFLGGEVAWVKGPWSFQGEVANTFLQTTEGEDANGLWGGYGSLSYFLTDDTRKYIAADGAFGRVEVKNPLQDGGWGAWQLASRFDYIDLNSGVARGGQQYSMIGGLNWYLDDYARVMLDGAVTQVFNAKGTDAAAIGSNNTIYGVGARVQVDW